MPNSRSAAAGSKTNWIRLFRAMVAMTVFVAIGYTAVKTSQQLEESEFDFRNVQVVWWCIAVAVYIATMTFAWLFWHRVACARATRPST